MLIKTILIFFLQIKKLLESGNAYEFFPRSSVTKNLLEAFCNATTVEACLSMLFMAVGKDYEEFSKVSID